MKNNFFIFVFFVLSCAFAFAQQKARILSDDVDVYAEQDFDSEILETVHRDETYWISNKTYGPFYRIKLKSGKIGYIPDHELDIAGKGPFKPKSFGEVTNQEAKGKKTNLNKNNLKKSTAESTVDHEIDENEQMEEDYENAEAFSFHSFSINLVNLHEDTMGRNQVADMLAVGYKRLTSDYIWGGIFTWKAPDYYAEKTAGKASGFSVWGDVGANYFIPLNSWFISRITPGITAHYSMVKVEKNLKKYDLQDLTVGVFVEAGLAIRIKKSHVELSLRFNHEKNDYGSLGLALLF